MRLVVAVPDMHFTALVVWSSDFGDPMNKTCAVYKTITKSIK